MSHVLQFQSYRGLCSMQEHDKPLHMCDIYGNKVVGERLRQMLAIGNSRSWPEVVTKLHEENLSAEAMMQFFKPFHAWLEKANSERGYLLGWL